jgi:hypothetical protein
MVPFPRPLLPAQVSGEPGLSPRGGRAARGIERLGAARGGIQHRQPDRIEVFEHDPRLNYERRFAQ